MELNNVCVYSGNIVQFSQQIGWLQSAPLYDISCSVCPFRVDRIVDPNRNNDSYPLWPGDAKRQHRSGSILAKIPMLTSYRWDFLVFTKGQYHRKFPRFESLDKILNIINLILQPHLSRGNDWISDMCQSDFYSKFSCQSTAIRLYNCGSNTYIIMHRHYMSSVRNKTLAGL